MAAALFYFDAFFYKYVHPMFVACKSILAICSEFSRRLSALNVSFYVLLSIFDSAHLIKRPVI